MDTVHCDSGKLCASEVAAISGAPSRSECDRPVANSDQQLVMNHHKHNRMWNRRKCVYACMSVRGCT